MLGRSRLITIREFSSVESHLANEPKLLMQNGVMNLYEGMFIIKASLSDDARSKALERILQGLKKRKGEVQKLHAMGLRRLAYPIDGHKEGVYSLLYFLLPPTEVTEFWQECHLNEDLLRFITLRTEQVLETLEFTPLPQA